MMNILCVIIAGLLLGVVGMVAIPLSLFISKVEDETVCERCAGREECFAKKSVFGGKSDWLNEFMLIAYLKVRKQCGYAMNSGSEFYILYIFVSVILTSILFWSEGMNVVGVVYGVSAAALLSLSVVDWNTQYIPLEMNGIIFICGLIRIFVDFSNWLEHVIGLFAVSGFLLLVNCIFTPLLRKRYRQQEGVEIDGAMGNGDIKLMAATGLLLGWKLNLLAFVIGCIAGTVIHGILIIIKKGERQLSFGPYLSLGVYVSMICGEQLISWYLNIIGITAYIK